MKRTKAQVEKLPEDHPDRARFAAAEERKAREKEASKRNKARMKKLRSTSTETAG
jgi:hypothetical protein